MNTLSTRLVRTVGALLLGVAVAGAPALTYAQGMGHFGGGGGHFSGGHFGGGGHVSAPHFSGGHIGGGHFAGGAHFAAPGGHFAGGYHGGAVHGAFPGVSALHAGAGHFAGRPGYWHGGYGYTPGWGYWHGWGGGYWGGLFWPHVWFNPGWAWFLPVLPIGYATYWWGGVPYYYYNNLYYTWNAGDNGYVVTDPPPAGEDSGSASASGSYSEAGPQNYAPPAAPTQGPTGPTGGGAGDVYLYPRNGQSDTQTQNDRYECHSWASNQTGFDPTRSSNSGNAADYKRAMIACLDARGYSAR